MQSGPINRKLPDAFTMGIALVLAGVVGAFLLTSRNYPSYGSSRETVEPHNLGRAPGDLPEKVLLRSNAAVARRISIDSDAQTTYARVLGYAVHDEKIMGADFAERLRQLLLAPDVWSKSVSPATGRHGYPMFIFTVREETTTAHFIVSPTARTVGVLVHGEFGGGFAGRKVWEFVQMKQLLALGLEAFPGDEELLEIAAGYELACDR